MIELKQSTSQVVPLGFFLDNSDGDTEEVGLTISNTDIKIWKFGATSLVDKNSGGGTHMSNGVYYCTLNSSDTNTLGPLVIYIHMSGALVVKLDCSVVTANYWDSKYSTDKLQVDVSQILNNNISESSGGRIAGNFSTFYDNGDAATSSILNNIATIISNITTIDTVVDAIKAITDNLPNSGSLTDISSAITAIDTVVDAIKLVTDNLPNSGSLTDISSAITVIDTVVDAIKLVTDNLPNSGSLTDISSAITAIDIVVDAIRAVTDNLPDSGALSTIDGLVDAIAGAVITSGVNINSSTMNSIADALLVRTDGVESGHNLRAALRIILSALASKVSGASTNSPVFRDINDTKNRISASTDEYGNRISVTIDAT